MNTTDSRDEPELPDRAAVLERMRARAEREGVRLTVEQILDAKNADKR